MPAKQQSGKKSSGRKYGKAASKAVESAMRRKKHGSLKSGSGGKGGKVKSRKQAIAIGLSEARKKGAKVPSKKPRSRFVSNGVRRIIHEDPRPDPRSPGGVGGRFFVALHTPYFTDAFHILGLRRRSKAERFSCSTCRKVHCLGDFSGRQRINFVP
jgi:hypothetical protein